MQTVVSADFTAWLKTQRAEHKTANNKKLVQAARSGDLHRIERLLRRGTDINEQDASGNTPLMAALLAWQYAAAERILDAGPDLSLCNHLGEDPLMYASLRNQPGIVVKMLRLGADPNARNRAGVPVLHFALVGPHSLTEERGWGSLPVVELLVAHGADPNVTWQGRSLLQWAEPETDPAIVMWLRERC
ncbi:MAG: hypothetical protein EOP50_17320 [Sphingobacteriales bacterium]|nr:MAG: hypothetical protein EOP50_17320 [Sphingobacteriales bacterium]